MNDLKISNPKTGMCIQVDDNLLERLGARVVADGVIVGDELLVEIRPEARGPQFSSYAAGMHRVQLKGLTPPGVPYFGMVAASQVSLGEGGRVIARIDLKEAPPPAERKRKAHVGALPLPEPAVEPAVEPELEEAIASISLGARVSRALATLNELLQLAEPGSIEVQVVEKNERPRVVAAITEVRRTYL